MTRATAPLPRSGSITARGVRAQHGVDGGFVADSAPTEGGVSDAVLAHRAARGDRSAASALWQRHRRWIAVVLLAHKSADADLDDLMQEVACAFVAKIGELRDPSRVRPWLRMIAVNAARAHARSMRLRLTEPLRDVDVSVPVDTSDADLAERLLARVHGLPEEYREPLLLRCLHEMSTRQVAQLLELPETTVETRVSRARRMLRTLETGPRDRDGERPGATRHGT